jgi:hypothetical protein
MVSIDDFQRPGGLETNKRLAMLPKMATAAQIDDKVAKGRVETA